MNPLTRRAFLRKSTKAAAGILAVGSMPQLSFAEQVPKKSRVALIKSSRLWVEGKLNQPVILQMLDRGIQAITGYDSPSKAWNSLFFPNDIVGIKINCIGKTTGSTKSELSYGVAECLHRYVNIPNENIIIFDRSDKELILGGYSINRSSKGVQVYSTPGYSRAIKTGQISAGFSTIITEKCTALINIPLLKTHRGAKLTLSLKNHYGSIQPEVVQTNKFHAEGFEHIVDINLCPPIREKTRLCVADGIIAQFDQGPRGDPRFQWKFGGLIIGRDPVAVDVTGLQVINEKRVVSGSSELKVKYLDWASKAGLGLADKQSIELVQEIV